MKSVGIIAEYNPFHNGHLYQLNKVKEMFPDAVIVLILGGNFLQRGEPSLIDKWTKSEIAIQSGIDIVVELPFPFASQSADIFAHGAISLLQELQVDKLVFGSESNDIETLQLLVDTQLEHPEYNTLVSIYLKAGYNYPTALSMALFDLTGEKRNTPNDLLGISYIKEIKRQHSKIIPVAIQRTNQYHNPNLENDISSATSIRRAVVSNQDVSNVVPNITLSHLKHDKLHFLDDYFPFLKYKIMTCKDLSIYQTVDEGIEHRIQQKIQNATCFEELVQNIKTKRYTYNKIQRMLIHILCDFTKEEAKKMQEIPYIRILDFSKRGRQYLNNIKKQVHLPLITNFSKFKHEMLDLEYRVTSVYASTLPELDKITLIEEEYKHHPDVS